MSKVKHFGRAFQPPNLVLFNISPKYPQTSEVSVCEGRVLRVDARTSGEIWFKQKFNQPNIL